MGRPGRPGRFIPLVPFPITRRGLLTTTNEMASAVSRSAFDWYSQHRIDGLRSIQCDEVADDV